MHEALLATPEGIGVRCGLCERRCAVAEGEFGWCGTRQNRGGHLFNDDYGRLSSVAADPIEKKPLYHFHPGTLVMTAGSWSCNFTCPWCQNWEISKTRGENSPETSPAEFVHWAQEAGCKGVAFSYNEPALSLEWALDVISMARGAGLYSAFVTNGSMTSEAFARLAAAGLDALNVDIKGSASAVRHYCGFDPAAPWATCRRTLAAGLHLEITTLVIPGVNEDDASLTGIANRIADELSRSVPWHLSAYHPAWHFPAPATPPATLERACRLGKDAGLEFVYTGNLAGTEPDTLCPGCGKILVRRLGYQLLRLAIRNGCCPRCERRIPGVWA
jgi:pyruvate formate lyase activating enzyme